MDSLMPEGKPTIKVCRADEADVGYIGYLEWESPDIDSEKQNYEVTFSVTYAEKTKKKSTSLELEDDYCIKPVSLKSGKNYIFTVKSTYRHIDTNTEYAFQASQELITVIKKPCIKSIDWENELILINWKKAEGALNHTLKILDDQDNEIGRQNVKDTQKTISYRMTRSCRYGMICSFVIEAHGPNNEMQESRKITTVLGGDTAVINVTAEIVEKRQVLVKWQEPESKANNYEICIFEVDAKEKKTPVTTKTSSELRYLFKHLKSKTFYQFSVRPVYQYETGDLPFSESEKIKTPESEGEAIERDDKFGTPEDIVVKILEDIGGQCKIQVMWTAVYSGANYIVQNYHVKLSTIKKIIGPVRMERSRDESNKLDPKITSWTSKPVETGHQYDIVLSTSLRNLDSGKERESKKEERVFAEPQKIVTNVEVSQEEIKFCWDEIPGAESYKIIVQDDLQKTTLVNQCISEYKSPYPVPIGRDLRVGQTCFVKVEALISEETICESDWKNFFIGDDECPRNVKASHRGTLVRSLDIVFDMPLKGPAPEYRIVAVPADQRGKKTMYTSSAMCTFCCLRSNTQYHFETSAIWNKDALSLSSRSNDIRTYKETETSTPLWNVSKSKNTQMRIESNIFATFGSSEQPRHHTEPHFGIVRNLKVEHYDEEQCQDIVKITWDSPLFEEDSNYWVISYLVEYQKGSNKVQKKEVKNGHSCRLELDLGFIYTVYVKTKFEIIDSCTEKYSEGWKEQVYTRPSKPKIHEPEIDFRNDELLVKWAATEGAKSFRVMIHTNESKLPVLDNFVERDYIYRKKFDDKLGYGMTFFAKVMAYGEGNLTNTAETESSLIGGDRVPSNVRASSNNDYITDPSTQAHVSWTDSELPPQCYQLGVYSYPEMKSVREEYGIKENHFLVTELKAGFNYVFKVHAVHNGNPTSGCRSNKVNTEPVPMRVKNVKAKPGDDASTTGIVEWDEILDDENKDEIKYCVYLSSLNNSAIRQEETNKHIISFLALQPATSYHVKVRAINSKGSGRWSEDCFFTTDFHKPRRVTLDMPQDDSKKCLRLTFQPANGSPLRHVCKLIRHASEGDEVKTIPLENGQHTRDFMDFEANQLYSALVHAVFQDGTGEQCGTASNKIRTYPSKTIITTLECYDEEGKGSTQFLVGWNEQPYVDCYELSIMRGASSETENVFFVKGKNKLIYSCQHEASDYFVQVRAKNETGFGDLSTKENVKLAPSKLRGIHAELGIDGKMVISCEAASDTSIRYCMTPLCKGEKVIHDIPPPIISNKIEWLYTPKNPATPHVFELWAENSEGDESQRARSEQIMSKPTRASKPTLGIVTDSDGFPTTNISISWEGLYGCDFYIVKVLRANHTSKEQGLHTCEECLENCLNCTGTNTVYNCSSPGSTYRVKICGVAGSSRGNWSEKSEVKLVPDKVKLIEAVTNTPVEKIYIRWKKLVVAPDGYRIRVFRENEREAVEDLKFLNDVTEYTVRRDKLIPGNRYYYQVSAYNETSQGLEFGIPTTSKQIVIAWMLPRLDITPDEANPYHKAKIEWEKPAGVNFYELEIQNKEHETVYKKRLEDVISFVFEGGLPGNVYSVRLYCGYNSVRDENCVERTMIMHPLPPSNIKVTAGQDNTRLIVEFNDKPLFHKEYIIRWKCLSKGFEQTQTSDPIKEHRYLVSGLKPGAQYEIAVLTVVSNTKSQYAYCSNLVQTLPAIVKQLRSTQNDDGSIMFGWDHLHIHPSEYIVQWKMNDKDLIEQSTVGNTVPIHDPEPGSCYRFRVKAMNTSGKGRFSDWKDCFTRPDSPIGLNAECLSPALVKIWCDPVKRATSYIFNVNGDCYKRETPLLEYKNNKETENFQINVCASIENVSGLPSKTLLFKQTLLHLKKKFKRIAKNQLKYLPLEFRNLATGDRSISFQSGLSDIEKGETCLVVGEYCTGKTSTCCHCIENLDDGELGVYLDYEDFRGNERNMNVETVIGECMKDLHPDEISSVLKWMKENSELVLFFIENLSLPTEYTSKIIQYGYVTGKEHVFYNISSTRREIFPDARIICTTCYEHMDTILHPTTALQIAGCCDEQIEDVTREIYYDDKENSEVYEAIRYFCINPLYRNIILKLGKLRYGLDLKSFSDMVIKLLEESMNRLPYERRIVRSQEFAAAILHSQSQIFSIPTMTTQNKSCKRLHVDVMKALYFGYFCSSKEFESVFEEKNGIVVPLASGMLKETNTKRLEELFRAAGKPTVDFHKKVGKMKEYLNNQMKQIHKHASANHRVALNLLQSGIELGYKKIADTNIKLKISNSLESGEVNEIALFLAKVQSDFCPHIKVKLMENIRNDRAQTINDGIKKNSFTKENPTKTIPVASGKMEFRIWERSTDLMHIRRKTVDCQEIRDVKMGCSNPAILPEHEDIKLDKKSEISSTHKHSVRQAVESQESNYRAPLHGDKYPLEKITECVGPEGKTIYIGGCSVTFPPGCFGQMQEVSVTAEINPNLWPDNEMGVTPTLDINAHSLIKKAKVKLTTWCLPDDEAGNTTVDVLHFDEKNKVSTRIHHCSVNSSRIIEFKTKHFSKLGAFLRKVGLRSPIFGLQSIVYYSKEDFAVAVILDNKTIRKKCLEDMKDHFANPHVKENKFNVFSCKKKDTVYSLVFCDQPGFDFDPPERFQHQISDVFKCQSNSIAYSVLHSTNETQEIRIKYTRSKNGLEENQAFRYDWNLGESTVTRRPARGNGNQVAGMVNYGKAMIFKQECPEVFSAPTT